MLFLRSITGVQLVIHCTTVYKMTDKLTLNGDTETSVKIGLERLTLADVIYMTWIFHMYSFYNFWSCSGEKCSNLQGMGLGPSKDSGHICTGH